MPDGGLVESALVTAAISTAGSLLASTIFKPPQPKSPVAYPPNEITRGGYLPVVYGRRVVGCHVGWVGDRGSFSVHTSAQSSMGTATPSTNLYLEGGWHQLCHGPVRRLYRIWQGSQILWHTLIDNTTTADGATFQAGTANNPGKTGDNFQWRSGRDPLLTPSGSAPYQPVNAYLQTNAGLVSAYPGLCDVVWSRKLLGGAPSWPLMKYEIETFPSDVMAAAGLSDFFTANSIPIYFTESTPATSELRSVTVWLNGQQSIPAGSYTITYVQGAFKLNADAGWQTYAPDVENFFINVVTSAGTAITTTPYIANESIRPPNQYDTQEAAEAANAGASKTFKWPGGPMGFEFGDITDWPGASPGTPNPTYSVQLTAGGPTYTASIAVQGGAAGSGDSGWNPAVALYVLLCAPFPYGCGIPLGSIDQTALMAVGTTLAAERLVVNMLIDGGQEAGDAVGGLMADVGMLLPQVGNLLTPYLVRTETTVMSVPLDLVEGSLPEQQRQVSNFGGDRYTFTIDDILNDGATSDITIDNDAQAFVNNRPRSQTIKLPTITCRSVAAQVAIRRAVELVAQAHKVPAMTLLREARNPAFHAGRTFILDGVQYRITGYKPDTVGVSAEIDAVLDQYGDTSITFDLDDDDVNYSVPPAAPPAPDLFFNPIIIPRSEWPSASTPVFGVPRVRANDAVSGAAVWISTSATGTYTQVGEQDLPQAGGTLLTAFNATPGLLATGPSITPYNSDITGVPDLTGDAADYDAGELTLVCEAEIMLLESVTANTDGSYTLNNVTRGAFNTTVAAHAIGTPAVIVSREDLSPIPSALLAATQGGTLYVKTQPTDGQTYVDLSLVTPEPLAVPLNLLATINVTGPVGGTVYVGQPVTVTWQSAQLTGTLTLSYSTNGGTTWTTIASGVADSGTYSWATTGLSPASAVTVRVASTTTPTVYAVSYPFVLAAAVAPGAPTGLTAAAGNTTVALAWTPPTGSPAPQLYRVKQSMTSGSGYVTIATISAPAGETLPTGYVVTGLTNGTDYFYVVTAIANGAESAASGQASATPVAPVAADGSTAIPSAPTGLTATPGSLIVSLAWTASTPVSAGTYNVLRSTTSGGPYTTVQTGISGVAYTDTGLTNGTEYYYVVTGTNDTGTSAQSGQASATPSIAYSSPPVPASATRTIWLDASKLTGYSTGQAVVTWSDASSNGTSVTQSTSGQQPTYQAASLNGLGVVRFDNAQDNLRGGPSVTGPNYAVFIVFRPETVDSNNHRAFTSSSSSVNFLIGHRAGEISAYAGGFVSANTVAATVGTAYQCTLRYNGSASFRINGTDNTASTTPSSLPVNIMLGYGSPGGGSGEPASADIAEVIVYDGTVSDTERSAIESYLNSKWGT